MKEPGRAEQAILEWMLKRSVYWEDRAAAVLDAPGVKEPDYLLAHDIRSELNNAMMRELPMPGVWNALVVAATAEVDFFGLARLMLERCKNAREE